MNLLFDQNISFRVVAKIKNNFPDAKHIKEFEIQNYSDLEILEFAKENKFIIVTFDPEFYDLSNLKERNSKIIWLRFGNTITDFLATILNARQNLINDFINSKDYSEITCLKIK